MVRSHQSYVDNVVEDIHGNVIIYYYSSNTPFTLVKFSKYGIKDELFIPKLSPDPHINDLSTLQSGKLLVAGIFKFFDNKEVGNIAMMLA